MNKLKIVLTRIQTKLLLSFVLLIVVPILTAILLYYESSNRLLTNEIQQSGSEMLAKLADRVNTVTERIYQASHLIINDPEMIEYLQAQDQSWLVDYDAFQQYKAFSKKLVNIRDFLLETEAYVAVIDFRGHLTATWALRQPQAIFEQIQQQPWFSATAALQGAPLWSIFDEPAMYVEQGRENVRYLTMTRLITGSTGKRYGMVWIAVPMAAVLPEMFNSGNGAEQSGSTLFLTHEQGLLVGDDQAFAALDRRFLINEQPIHQLGWSLKEAMPREMFSDRLQSLRNKSILWIFALLIFCCCIFVLIMLRIMNRLKILQSSMSKVGLGNFTPIQIGKGNDELVLLSRKFNDMVFNLSVLVKNVAEEQKRKEEARFQALQAQVRPHFLFNTLTSIKWSAKLSGAEHVSEMITSLGRMLKYSMKTDKERVMLQEEIEFLNSYVALQNIRFNNRVHLRIQMDEALLAEPILKFMLQPVVENSIMHGRSTPLLITVEGERTAEMLVLRIRDNGGGQLVNQVDSEDACGENTEQGPISLSQFSGIGLNNIHERIKLHFGGDYGLHARSIHQEGFEVTLQLPLQREGGN